MPTEYVRHFGLVETPFARNHDTRWLYLSAQHKEAVLKTRWCVEEHGGLALIRADVGHGKTSLIEYVMSAWPRQFGWRCAKLQNTGTISTPRALLAEVMAAFGLPPSHTARDMATRLEAWLLTEAYERGSNIVLFVDEAQSIDARAMPVLRDLVNLETPDRILLQVVMAAQLTIDRKLGYYPALQSRIASVATLLPLTESETDAMLLHRFKSAGAADPMLLCPADAVRAIYRASGGVPRDVVMVAEAAMKEAFLRDSRCIRPEHVERGVEDMACRRPRFAKAA